MSRLWTLSLSDNQLQGEIPISLTGLNSLTYLGFHKNPLLCAPLDENLQAWMDHVDEVHGSSCAPMTSQEDRAVLSEFYSVTEGATWDDNSNWLSDRPVREWFGVTVNEAGRVNGLYLSDNHLSGAIPAELGNLFGLVWLALRTNQLNWPIPMELENLSNLRMLYLRDNPLIGCIPPKLKDVEINDLYDVDIGFCGSFRSAPWVSIAARGVPTTRINSAIPVAAAFRQPVSEFTEDDITVTNGSLSNFVARVGGFAYTFEVTPDTVGEVVVHIAADVARNSFGIGNTPGQLSLGLPYDDDRDGAIGRAEVIEAVKDYFGGNLTRDQILAIIHLYFFGTS